MALSPQERLAVMEIERRRSFVRKPPDPTLGGTLDRAERSLREAARRDTSLKRAWRDVCPAELRGRVRAVSLAKGTMILGAADQSAKFLADRALRGPLRKRLADALGATISRVTVRVGGADAPATATPARSRAPRRS